MREKRLSIRSLFFISLFIGERNNLKQNSIHIYLLKKVHFLKNQASFHIKNGCFLNPTLKKADDSLNFGSSPSQLLGIAVPYGSVLLFLTNHGVIRK
ncbi:hypothetical protein BHE94_15710 [Bacillus pumilus]|nr:hypothetical protein BHE94_15710 [Bacillus pumilus]